MEFQAFVYKKKILCNVAVVCKRTLSCFALFQYTCSTREIYYLSKLMKSLPKNIASREIPYQNFEIPTKNNLK